MRKLLGTLLLAFMVGCASLGGTPPQSVDETLGASQGQVDAVNNSAAQALMTGLITVADARVVLALTDQATAALDAARTAEGTGDLTTIQAKLSLVSSLLLQAAQYLQAKGVK